MASERMARIESDVGYIKQKLDDLCDRIEKGETRYAAKWVEKVVTWILTLVGGAGIAFALQKTFGWL